jgi:Domain of unknown function DUF87.
MGLFRKKRKEPISIETHETVEDSTIIDAINTKEIGADTERQLANNKVGIHEILAPSYIDRSQSEYIRVGRYFAKALMITGMPRVIEVGTLLNPILQHDSDVDITVHIQPYGERDSLDELVKIATRLRAEQKFAIKSGDDSSTQELETAIVDALSIRDSISTNSSKLFAVNIVATLYAENLEELKEKSDLLEGQLQMRSVHSRYADGRMDEGYLSGTPLGVNFCQDTRRNLDSFAVSTLFPFITADFHHRKGVPVAINYFTGGPILFDPHDPTMDNFNSFITAGSGKGKSTLTKTFINRLLFTGEVACVLDPMSEYSKLALARGGISVKIGPGTQDFINPCDLSKEFNSERKCEFVNIDDKITDMTALIDTMCEGLKPDEASFVETIWVDTYRGKFGFSEDPESLFEEDHSVSGEGKIISGKFARPMPRLRDFYDLATEENERTHKYDRLLTILKRYLQGNPLGFFDCYTNVQLENKPIIVFDLNSLGEGVSRTVGMHAVLTWVDQHFIKKDRNQRGRIYVDEAWQLARGKSAVSTMNFLEALYRRARHHRKGITAISQDFEIFARHEQGQAIFQNSDTLIFLNNKAAQIKAIQQYFDLSEGELDFISNAGVGEGIMRIKDKSVAFRIINTPSEKELVYSTKPRVIETDVLIS